MRQADVRNPRSPASLTRSRLPLGNYGWLKRGLTACASRDDEELRALAATMTAGAEKEHPRLPAGYTYFGQLLAHDLTFQSATTGQRRNDPDSLQLRTPAFASIACTARAIDQPTLPRDAPWKLLTGRPRGVEGRKGISTTGEPKPEGHEAGRARGPAAQRPGPGTGR